MTTHANLRILALDFDGVISDSAPESFVVALRTSLELPGVSGPRARRACEELAALDPMRVSAHSLFREFLALMPLGNRAEDFGVALQALERGVPIADQQEYDSYRDSLGSEFLSAFHRAFYRHRQVLQSSEPERWRALLGPYPRFVELLREPGLPVQLAIATAKDRLSVLMLLDDYGLRAAFADSRILDKEAGVSKRAHLSRIREEAKCDYAQITFVDDKLNHLEDVASLGVRPVLAAWGYNGERERARARALGIEVCELERARALVFAP